MSILRNVRAANLFTLSNVLRGNLGMPNKKSEEKQLSAEDRAFMVSTFGEDVVSMLEKDTEKMQQILSASLEFKNADPKADKAMTDKPMMDEDEEDEKEDEKQVSESGLTVELVAKATQESLVAIQQVLTEMQQKMSEYETKIAELESQAKETAETVEQVKQNDDQKIRDHWLPALDYRAGYQASQAKDNLVKNKKEKEELTEDAPKGTQAQPASKVMQYALAPLFQQGIGG